ncbi:MAG: rhodanese-like domain-containing protein, partial [Acidimicrobiia bacterium]|nr:rhodanese-like domain-containing protein [Acidimicrobiia bacterium]
WEAGHIEGALHIPMSQLADRLGELPQGRLTIVCRSGNRSGKVTSWLLGRGIDAVNMAGGMLAWSSAGRPLRDTEGAAGVVV